MKSVKLAAVAAFIWMSSAFGAAAACDGFKALSLDEMKESRNVLIDAKADSLDRLFAFGKLICSSNPAIRDHAIREGLKSNSDPLVRNQILLDAMLQKSRLNIKVSPPSNAPDEAKAFVAKSAGMISWPVQYVSDKDGCISLYTSDRCNPEYAAIVKGEKVEIANDGFVGEFRLTETNELVGFISTPRMGRFDALIELF